MLASRRYRLPPIEQPLSVWRWRRSFPRSFPAERCGFVVGATYPEEAKRLRELAPDRLFLMPGVGAQGATPADVARAFTSGPASALVNVSRNVIYAFRVSGMDWRSAAAAEASKYAREVWSVSGW